MDQAAAIRGRIQGLREELARIAPHAHNAERIASRKRGIELCEQQLERVERMHQRFLDYRSALVQRAGQYARMSRGAN
jgi:hypothetical protein